MIKVKAFVQLKSGLYGRRVMIYKFDQVWIICSCIEAPTLTTECGFDLKKSKGNFAYRTSFISITPVVLEL